MCYKILFILAFWLTVVNSYPVKRFMLKSMPAPIALQRTSKKFKVQVNPDSFLQTVNNHFGGLKTTSPVSNQSSYYYELEHTVTYKMLLEAGSNKQNMNIELDTGSSDLWLPLTDANIDKNLEYQYSLSSSFKKTGDQFEIQYASGNKAEGYWATDDIYLNNGVYKIPSLRFGAVTNTGHTSGGVLGIGFVKNEDGKATDGYKNLPVEMFTNGYTTKVAYSIYLSTQGDQTGEILFGAIDNAKYSGNLVSLPILMLDDALNKVENPSAFFVSLQSLSTKNMNSKMDKAYPALFDTGTSVTHLPGDIYDNLMGAIGVKISDAMGYVTECDKYMKNTLDFQFTPEAIIRVPFEEVLETLSDASGNAIRDNSNNSICRINLEKSGSESFILGDNFLRSAYVHYDLTDKVIKIAQAKYTDSIDLSIV